jgi:anti-sigma factor RsiW
MSCRKWQIIIFRWQEGELNPNEEAALLRHLENCVHCRASAEKFLELDRLFVRSPDPAVPPFLNQRIISSVIEEMSSNSWRSTLYRFIDSLAFFRPALAVLILVLGLGLGVLTGLNLSHSINLSSTASSYDLLALAGTEDGPSASSLDSIWTGTSGGGR